MSEPKKIPQRPLPTLKEPDTQAFWRATKDKAFTYQQCTACDNLVFYPRAHCDACGSSELDVKTSAGKGRVYTYSIVRQSYHPFFRQQVPYAVAWIDLDEGPRLISNVIGVDDPATEIHCDMPVTIEWEEHDELCIPLFKPA